MTIDITIGGDGEAPVRIDGQDVARNPVLARDTFDAMLLAAESVGGVRAASLFCNGEPCCPWGVAAFLDGCLDFYIWDDPGPCLTALAQTGVGVIAFDAAIRELRNPRTLRVPLADVFSRLGIVRGAA